MTGCQVQICWSLVSLLRSSIIPWDLEGDSISEAIRGRERRGASSRWYLVAHGNQTLLRSFPVKLLRDQTSSFAAWELLRLQTSGHFFQKPFGAKAGCNGAAGCSEIEPSCAE